MKIKLKIIITAMLLLCLHEYSEAATSAYFFTYNKVYKIDVDKSKLLWASEFPYNLPMRILDKTVFFDKRNNTLIILDDKDDIKIKIIDLKTFALKNELDMSLLNKDSGLPTVIIPPNGNDLFVKWFDGEKSTEITTKYTNVDFKRGQDVNYPFSYEYIGYSSDGSEFYSLKKIMPTELNIFDSSTLALKEKRNLDSIFVDKNKPRGIDDYVAGTMLFSEGATLSPSDPLNSDIFYLYKIIDKTVTPRINTNSFGMNSMLSPDRKLLVISEATLHFIETNAYESINTGKISVFNVDSGEKVGTVNIQTDKFSKINGISPDSTKAYVISKVPITGDYKLSIIDLTKKTIIIEIPKISFGREMIFFEE